MDAGAGDGETLHDRRRMRPEDRRSAILDAALAVFAETGFGRASLNEVAEQAGVTKGCLYHHFDSKEELLLALMRESARRSAAVATAAAADAGSRDAALAALVRTIWRHYQEPGQIELASVALTELPRAPELARVHFDEVVARNRAAMREALAHDAPGVATDDELVAILIPYMIMGAALGLRVFRGIDPAVRTPDEIERALMRLLLGGIVAPEEGRDTPARPALDAPR